METRVVPAMNLEGLYKRRLIATSALIGIGALSNLPVILSLAQDLLSIVLSISIIFIAVICIVLALKGYIKVAGWLLSSSLLIAIVLSIPPLQAISRPIILAYAVPIVVAGLVSSYHVVVAVGMSLIMIIVGAVVASGADISGQVVTTIIILLVITGLLWLVLRDLSHALRQTTLLATETQHAYEEVAQERLQAVQRNQELEAANEAQRRLFDTIQDLETPILTLHSSMLVLPLVGHVDTHRALTITERVLKTIEHKRTGGIIIDISGIAVVDTLVIKHLVELVQSVRLMGSQVIISGVNPKVAHTMVTLGVNFGTDIVSASSLQDGIRAMQVLLERRN